MMWLWALLAALLCSGHAVDQEKTFRIPEGVAIGSLVGYIADKPLDAARDSFLLIVQDERSAFADAFRVDNRTGEIKTRSQLDYEQKASYSFLALPVDGAAGIHVSILIIDQNDNAPEFESPTFDVQISEYIRLNSEISLPTATDRDSGQLGVQGYSLVSGNVNNAFRLASKHINGVVYVDLIVNSEIDREFRDTYQLVVEAHDGADPPMTGRLLVNITVEDANDNVPIFRQAEYSASVEASAAVGTAVVTVDATDADAGDNAAVTYSLQSATGGNLAHQQFSIHPSTGVISLAQPLTSDSERRRFDCVVVARDSGRPHNEASAFVSIKVLSSTQQSAQVSLIFLGPTGDASVSEAAVKGELVARVSVSEADQSAGRPAVSGSMAGHANSFVLEPTAGNVFVLRVDAALDREVLDEYNLVMEFARGTQVVASHKITLTVTDVNDNAPVFTHKSYQAQVNEKAQIGSSVLKVTAVDADSGANGRISYSFAADSPLQDWFALDAETGLISTGAQIDCEQHAQPELIVVATDHGTPNLSDRTKVLVNVIDVNDNKPEFVVPMYNLSIAEDTPTGTCFVSVSASDPDCGVNAQVHYSLAERTGAAKQPLSIQPNTGKLCLNAPLDFEREHDFQMQVVAHDGGGMSNTALVQVNVLDVNDNAPVFYPTHYNISVRQDEPRGTPLQRVSATDADKADNDLLVYSIRNPTTNMFRVDPDSGDVYVNGSLVEGVYELQVMAADRHGWESSQPAHVSITVQQNNLRDPHFTQRLYSFNVPEDTLPGIAVGDVKAMASADRRITYAIYSGDPQGYFGIDHETGTITVASSLDADTHASVMLNIQAAAGYPPTYNHTQVRVEVKDVNDNAPVFQVPVVHVSVSEAQAPHQEFFAVRANDKDQGENGKLIYKLLSVKPEANGLFLVNPERGTLSLQSTVDFERGDGYRLVIGASDNGLPTMSANVTVHVAVLDANDNAPMVEQAAYSIQLPENTPVMHKVLHIKVANTIQASDADSGRNGQISYSLDSTETESEEFGIFADSGWLYVRRSLDRETREQYNLTVIALDNGSPQLRATTRVNIQLLDVNDNVPSCASLLPLSITESAPAGSLVGVLLASDPDLMENGTVTYYPAAIHSVFRVEPNGLLYTKAVLDAESEYEYSVSVLAQDQSAQPLQATCVVKVQVLDENDNEPVFILPHNNRIVVPVPQVKGMQLGTVRAIDPDQGRNGTVTYSIADNEQYGVYFSVGPTDGLLRLRQLISATQLSNNPLTLRVQAHDGGQPQLTAYKQLVIDVQHNTQPTLHSDHTNTKQVQFNVSESVAVGQRLGAVDSARADHVRSMDAGADVPAQLLDTTYTIEKGNSERIFSIDRITSVLYMTAPVDYETTRQHRLTVRKVVLKSSVAVSWQQPLAVSSLFDVLVHVLDENDNAPAFSHDPVLFSVSERMRVGSTVYTMLNATDDDTGPNGRITYSIVKQQPEPNMFSIDPLTGHIRLDGPLDYERVSEYLLVVAATDQAEPSVARRQTRVTASVYVTDYNDNQPLFRSPNTTFVDEDSAAGEPLFYVLATDADWQQNGRIAYSIGSGNERAYFKLNGTTGALSLARRFGRDSPSTYQLHLVARDGGTPPLSSTQQLTVTVRPVHSAAPRFTQSTYSVNVSETAVSGTRVAALSALHSTGDSVAVKYVLPNGVGFGRFRLNADTGELQTTSALDREHRSLYNMIVFAYEADRPTLYDSARVFVHIDDANDNAPQLLTASCLPLQVPENARVDTLHQLVATDKDGPSPALLYSIISGNSEGLLHLNPMTGVLSCEPLDREAAASLQLNVSVTDGQHTDHCLLSIDVLDQNDNAPKFLTGALNARIAEDAPPGTLIGLIEAIDPDEGNNGLVVYSLRGHTGGLFEIDPTTGALVTTGRLDFEQSREYVVTVQASDRGLLMPRSSQLNVTIGIDDVNDNSPVFERDSIVVDVSQQLQMGQRVTRVKATDADAADTDNARLLYSFSQPLSEFSINPQTGVISTRRPLTLNRGSLYLTVVASDAGEPARSSQCVVRLRAPVAHTSEMRFVNDSVSVWLREDVVKGTHVAQLQATRANGDSQGIQYAIVSGNQPPAFSLHKTTGELQVEQPALLDADGSGQQRLIVQAAIDSTAADAGVGSSEHVTYTIVQVKYRDVNDHAPRFIQQHYATSVYEGQTRGTFVAQVSAVDHDTMENAALSYSIIGGNKDAAFSIDTNGVLSTNVLLDREIIDLYKLTIIASDDGAPAKSGTATMDVQVIDKNDNPPSFPRLEPVNVLESSPVGALLATVTAYDVDAGPPLEYTILAPQGNVFSLERFSGRLTLSQQLDYEKQQSYELTLQVSDGVHQSRTSLLVVVLDVNEHAPEFDMPFYQLSVPEGTAAGSSLMQVLATDADAATSSNQVTYQLLDDPLHRQHDYSINPQTGALFNNRTFGAAADTERLVRLVVQALDNGVPQLWATTTINVHIVPNTHHSQPLFATQQFSFDVAEDLPVHSTIGRLSISNPQAITEAIVYRILNGDAHKHFYINSEGQVTLNRALDRETVDEYRLRVAVHTRTNSVANSTAMLIVNVLDVNDNAPQLKGDKFELQLNSDAAVGTTLMVLEATDPDLGDNKLLSYEITSGNEQSVFKLDRLSGVISLAKAVSSRAYLPQQLVVKVTDAGTPALSDIQKIQVVVVNENSNAPFFPVPLYLARIDEDAPIGTTLFQVTATDQDVVDNDRILYSIVQQQARRHFSIHPKTGQVTTMAGFDYETKTLYHFTIRAEDTAGKQAETKGQVLIQGVDEYSPVFDHAQYVFKVSYAALVGDSVGSVGATDADDGRDGQLRYGVVPSNQYFDINPVTGLLRVKQALKPLYSIALKRAQSVRQSNKQAKEAAAEQRVRRAADGVVSDGSSAPLDYYVMTLLVVAYSGGINSTSHRTNSTKVHVHIGDFVPSAQSTMEFDPALVTIVSVILIGFTLFVLCCLAVMLRRKKVDKHNACASQRYRPANMQHTNGSAHDKQLVHGNGHSKSTTAPSHLPGCTMHNGKLVTHIGNGHSGTAAPLLGGAGARGHRSSRAHLPVPPPVVPPISTRSSGRGSDDESVQSHHMQSASRATNRSQMERSQPDSGIQDADADSLGSGGQQQQQQPSTAAYLEQMGVLPDVMPGNRHGRVRSSLATDTDKDMHDLIYCKLDDVLGDDDPSLVSAQYNRQRSTRARPNAQPVRLDAAAGGQPQLLPQGWEPKYQPLTQMFSEIKELKNGQDTLRRMKQSQQQSTGRAVSPNIWVPNLETGSPAGTAQLRTHHSGRPRVTVSKPSTSDNENNNQDGLEIKI